ncbi:AsmA-like C-terminal region-containing protein [Aurantibacillus circumpalustris]|uniref:AsmA-like C-terminal region-containing protein n=1 Tax=Aurantibacillus circumpalustris TaxID=3036359 RepID=UPI00295C2359|nr:AsmA-like C-terminal region-containing protein [Aurantibacillus circumpalustris]
MLTFILLEENPILNTKKRSVFKRIRRIILWIVSLVLFFILALITLLFVYENDVKAAIIKELNKHLKAEVQVDPKNIDLTIISSFPDCSIQFRNLLMLDAFPIKNKDTLLFAGQLNLHFNIKDLWNKNYEIKKIKLKQGVVKLLILKDGTPNYEFWNKSESKTNESGNINFNLKMVSVVNSKLSFKNKQSLIKTSLQIKQLVFKGSFKEEEFEMESDAKLFIHELVQGKTHYLREKECDIAMSLLVNDDSYSIKTAKVNLNKLKLELSGRVDYRDKLERADLKYKAPNLDIASLLSLLPEKFKGKINEYESSGNFYAEGTFRYLNKDTYSIVSDFGIKQGIITYKPNGAKATQVNLEGYLNYTKSASVLNLKNIHLTIKNDEIRGACLINDFENPYLKFSANATVKLENLINFWPIDTLSELKGNLQIDTEVEGLLSVLKEQAFSDKVKVKLKANVSKLEAKFKHDEKSYNVESCEIRAIERQIEVKDLKLERGSSDLKLNGKIPGVFNYLMDRTAPLTITGSLYSDYIKLEDFITPSGKSSETKEKPLIPSNVNFKLNAAIVKFSFGKFNANAITGEIEIKNQKAIVSDMKLLTMEGEAEINAFADNSKNRLEVALESKLSNINITELFSQLNNFGQEVLTEKNIKGSATATIEFSGTWNNKLEADLNSIHSLCNLQIERGELNDFKPLLSLSKFVDVEELKRIKFSSLQSAVEIKNGTIIIPRTSIKNSALDVQVSGTHTFDNHIDYHIQLLLNQYLAKKRKGKESEFGPIENDPEYRRSAFIRMTGTIDNPDIKYDFKGQKEKIKDDIAREKKTMKQLFKEEWNLFKKDTSVTKSKKPETVFELEKPEQASPKKTLELKKKEEEDF